MPISPTPRATGSTATAKRAPSAGVSQGAKGSPKAPSATNNATKGSPTSRPSINATSITSPRGKSTASSVAPSSARARTASSPAGTKRSASAARNKSVVSVSTRRGASISSAAEMSTKSTKKSKPQPVGNFYLPAHNLSFASNPLVGNYGGKRSSSVGDAFLAASPTSTGPVASPASAMQPFSPHDFSFSDPATIFAMSPSRAAATYERERVNYESRAASPAAVEAATTNNNTASLEDEDGPDVLANTAPSLSMPNPLTLEHDEGGEVTTGGDNNTAAASGDGMPIFTEAPPVLAEAPKFKSYFFGNPKPAPIETPHVNDTSAASPEGDILSSGTDADTIASPPAANGEENTSLVREASPAPAAPSTTKIVSFDQALATAEANQAAYNAAHGGGSAQSPSGISSEASPSMSTSYGSPASSASPLRASAKKKASSKSKSRASSASSAGGKRKGKAGSKKKKEKEFVDPEDCRPPGPVERLFGDIAKSGMTGAPTLASLAIVAHRTGSELDLKKAAAAEEDKKVSFSAFDSAGSVTPLQTANALFNLGWMHYHGLGGCGVNFKKAYAYFYDAATKFDHPMAHYYLGLHLRDGKGVERNLLAAHDAFQLSLSIAGGDNLKAPPAPAVVAGGTATIVRLADEDCPPYKELVLPTEFTPAATETKTTEKPSAADAEEVPTAEEKNTVIILNEVNKKAQTRVSAPPPLVFEGIVKSDVEAVVNWQVGKLWAGGSIVVLEEAPASAKVSSAAASKKDVTNESSATIGGASRAASPTPATPRARASSSVTIQKVATPRAGATKATSPSVSSPKGGSAARKSVISVATTTTKSVSKKAGASKKSSAAKNKKDPTNNTGGGTNVVIKRLLMQEAAGEDEAEAGAGNKHGSETQYLNLQFRKVRYAADKPVAISLFDQCAALGFEHAGLAAEILRDAPIPRAEVE